MVRFPHSVMVKLGSDDKAMLDEIVRREKDTFSNVIRRLIRSKHKRLFSPQPSLKLTLPTGMQSSEVSNFLPPSPIAKDDDK